MSNPNLIEELRVALRTYQPDAVVSPAEVMTFLDHWEQNAIAHFRQQQAREEMERMRALEEKRKRDALVDLQIKVLAATFEKANAYVNLLVIAGYASFFALWSFTKEIDAISQPMRRWAVLGMLASVSIFVFFETVKVMFVGWVTSKRQRLFVKESAGMSLEQLEAAGAALQAGIDRATTALIRVWPYALGATAFTAAASVGMLVAAILVLLPTGRI